MLLARHHTRWRSSIVLRAFARPIRQAQARAFHHTQSLRVGIMQRRLAETVSTRFTEAYKARHQSTLPAPEDEPHVVQDGALDWDPDTMALRPDLHGEDLPHLPIIKSDEIRNQVFTHRSFYARPTRVFEDLPNDPAPDNERLEHLGDSVLGLVVTDLLRDCFQHLRVGPATKIRALVVGNATLAEISVRYLLPAHLRVQPAQAITLRHSINVQADVFEAYVGGVFTEQGLDGVNSWLRALFRPYALEAYRIVRQQHDLSPRPVLPHLVTDPAGAIPWEPPSPADSPPPPSSVGYLALFNQYLQQHRKSVEWRFEDPRGEGTKTTPIWIASALLDGDVLAKGRANTKKAAQNEAAKEGLHVLGVDVALLQARSLQTSAG